MEWEAPVGRIVHQALDTIAEQIKKAIVVIVKKLKEKLEEEVSVKSFTGITKILFKKIPVLGWSFQIEEIVRKVHDVMSDLNKLKEEIERAVEALKAFLEFIKDPIGKIGDEFKEKLKPVTDKIEDAQKVDKLQKDLEKATDPNTVKNKPKQAYDTGSGHDPWADA